MAANSNDSIPSWDEFRNDDELDYDENVEEPTDNQDYGPSLPPGFVQDESNDLNDLPLSRNNVFPSLPTEQDDPEDPIMPSVSTIVTQSQRLETSDDLPIKVSGPEEPVPSSSSSRNIGPTLPPEFLPTYASNASKPSSSKEKPVIGPSLPVDFLNFDPDVSNDNCIDEPCTSNGTNSTSKHKSASLIGPTLPKFEPEPIIGPIGPTMPRKKSEEPVLIGPTSPGSIGPTLPASIVPSMPRKKSDEPDLIGPSLPKFERENGKVIGPVLPRQSVEEPGPSLPDNDGPIIGPTIPKARSHPSEPMLPFDEGESSSGMEIGTRVNGNTEEEDDDIVGPMPSANKDHEELEYLFRLREFEARQASKPTVKREQWMTEPPKKMAGFGLDKPKTSFSKSSYSAAESGNDLWTSTPNEASKPSTSASSSKSLKDQAYDSREEQRAAMLNANRQESLLDAHSRKRKAENGETSTSLTTASGERRPFNREIDMEVRGLSKVNTDELKEKMGNLSSRFGHGSSKKFL